MSNRATQFIFFLKLLHEFNNSRWKRGVLGQTPLTHFFNIPFPFLKIPFFLTIPSPLRFQTPPQTTETSFEKKTGNDLNHLRCILTFNLRTGWTLFWVDTRLTVDIEQRSPRLAATLFN